MYFRHGARSPQCRPIRCVGRLVHERIIRRLSDHSLFGTVHSGEACQGRTTLSSAIPDGFEFLSLDAFKKLSSNERKAYLERVARYVGALKDSLDEYGEEKEPPDRAAN